MGNKETELDLVEYDKQRFTLSIVQAKLTIPPDSVSEVDSVNKVILEAVGQLNNNKKLIEKNNNKQILLNQIGVLSKNHIDIKYFLLTTSFTGSDFLSIPEWINVMPIEFCLRPESKGKPLNSIHRHFKELWDSLNGYVNSSRAVEEFELGGYKIISPGFLL